MSRKIPKIGVGPAQTPRNAFDLSEHSLYTQPAGMLLPVFVKELNPHDHVSLDISSELQAQTLKGRAFVGMRQYFASYFVPYSYLWSYWNSFITGLSVNNTIKSSSLLHDNVNGVSFSAPTFKPLEYYRYLCDLPTNSVGDVRYIDQCGFPLLPSFVRLCDMLGYGNVSHYYSSKRPDFSGDLGQYEHEYDEREKRLTDYEANVFRWAAYQKIYQDHFLDDRFEVRDVASYQLDKYTSNSVTGSSVVPSVDASRSVFMPRYAKYNKDFLCNAQPSPLFIDSVHNVIKTFVGAPGYTSSSLKNSEYGVTVSPTLEGLPDTVNGVWNKDERTVFTASQIRNLFALDKMAQISSRAAKTYSAQMRAHYGVSVDGEEHVSLYCGGYSTSLDSQAVISTAETDKVSFGQQGSFIDNVSKGHINFDAKDFGVFMVISWIAPDLRWPSVGCDPFTQKLRSEDYYHPETEDLGMQPLTSRSMHLVDNTTDLHFGGISYLDDDTVLGWQPRYSEYKCSYDRLHGEFIPAKVLNSSVSDPLFFTKIKGSPAGSLSFLSSCSSGFDASWGPSKQILWSGISVSPNCCDNLFDVRYNGEQITDPYRVESEFRCSIVRDMGVSGLPRL
ncbi:MAG: major capsid protein [Segatella oris]|uniref:major capsid protein n=1 Tax=Segatella oris TaxID=28135 RepID=UPI003FA28A7E